MWICGGLAPCGPSALLAAKKASFGKKDMPFGNPLIMGQKTVHFSKILIFCYFFTFMGQKVEVWVKNGVFGCFGPSVR